MSGPLWLVPNGRSDALPELAGRLLEVCGAAVHPDEIAAVLESEGLTDEQVRAKYGRPSVFDLAAELYERAPRQFPEPPPQPDPWQTDAWRCLLRGVLFALPGLGYVLGARLLPEGGPDILGLPAGGGVLAVSVLFGWAWNQALAHRAYVLLGSPDGGRGAAARCLLTGAPLGALAVAVPALFLPDSGAAGIFAAGQSCYLGAATALLVLGGERLLLGALAPTVLGAAALAVTSPPAALTVTLLAATVLLAAGAAGAVLLEARGEVAEAPVHPAPPATGSLPYGFFGLAAGVLTLATALGGVLRYGAGTPVTGTVTVALTLSMGAAELLLFKVRSHTLAALRASRTISAFRAGAGAVLLAALAGYLALLALLGLAAAAISSGEEPVWLTLAGLLSLGGTLWLALLLQAFGTAWPSALVVAVAAAAEVTLLSGGLATPAQAQTAVGGCAAAALLALATVVLSRSTAHR